MFPIRRERAAGAGNARRPLILGSVTEKVLRRATCPVLTVPPPAQATSTLPFKQVLCAVHFSEPSLEAVRFAASLASQSGARLMLMHVLEWPWHEPPAPRLVDLPPAQAAALAEYRRDAEVTATAKLEAVASREVPHGTTAVAHVGHGKPYERLLDTAPGARGPDRSGRPRHDRARPGRLRADGESAGARGHLPGIDGPPLSTTHAAGN